MTPQAPWDELTQLEIDDFEADMRAQYDAAYRVGKNSGLMEGFVYGIFFALGVVLLTYWYLSS